jgi:hypothetical protein
MSEDTRTRRERIEDVAEDLAGHFLYYDRKEDEDLPRGQIEEALATGEITIEEIVTIFRDGLLSGTAGGRAPT